MQARATRCVVWGEIVWDRFPDEDRLGGAAANVAYHLSCLGAESVLVSCVGQDDLGQRALARLTDAGVNTRFVTRDAVAPTGTVKVTFDAGQPRYELASFAAYDRIGFDVALAEKLASARALVYGTLAQRTALVQGALVHALDVDGPTRVLDVNLRPPHVTREIVGRCLERAHVVKLNEHEAHVLAELLNTRDLTRYLLDSGAWLVALTRGERGARLTTATATVEHPGFAAAVGGDAVGAGDAFTALLAVEATEHGDLERLVRRANRYASWVASHAGAMPQPPAELAQWLQGAGD